MIDDVEFLKDSWEWPCYPMCPVKHRTKKLFGVVVTDHPTVYLKPLFEFNGGLLEPQLKDIEKQEYDSFEAMVADGWIVD